MQSLKQLTTIVNMFCNETLFPWQRTEQRSGKLNWASTGTLVSGLCRGFVFQETNIIAASNNAVQQGTVAKISSRHLVWLCILFPVAPKGEMQHFYGSLKINFLSCDIGTESIFRPHFLRQILKKKILTTLANVIWSSSAPMFETTGKKKKKIHNHQYGENTSSWISHKPTNSASHFQKPNAPRDSLLYLHYIFPLGTIIRWCIHFQYNKLSFLLIVSL